MLRKNLKDKPKKLHFDGAQYFDISTEEDYPDYLIKEELGIPEIKLIDRKHWYCVEKPELCNKNHFCILEGEQGKIVIGGY